MIKRRIYYFFYRNLIFLKKLTFKLFILIVFGWLLSYLLINHQSAYCFCSKIVNYGNNFIWCSNTLSNTQITDLLKILLQNTIINNEFKVIRYTNQNGLLFNNKSTFLHPHITSQFLINLDDYISISLQLTHKPYNYDIFTKLSETDLCGVNRAQYISNYFYFCDKRVEVAHYIDQYNQLGLHTLYNSDHCTEYVMKYCNHINDHF